MKKIDVTAVERTCEIIALCVDVLIRHTSIHFRTEYDSSYDSVDSYDFAEDDAVYVIEEQNEQAGKRWSADVLHLYTHSECSALVVALETSRRTNEK
jgi:hypothetical protein